MGWILTSVIRKKTKNELIGKGYMIPKKYIIVGLEKKKSLKWRKNVSQVGKILFRL